jgi:hypothetical protein
MWIDIVTAIGSIGAFAGFIALAWQVRSESKTRQFEIYERISTRFSDVLWASVNHPELHDIWAKDQTWLARNDKLEFRYTRRAFDVLEQAWEANEAGLIEKDVWDKWEAWIRAWKTTKLYEDVVVSKDPNSPFQPQFVEAVEKLKSAK